jgi:hypothetical protein
MEGGDGGAHAAIDTPADREVLDAARMLLSRMGVDPADLGSSLYQVGLVRRGGLTGGRSFR